MGSRGAVRNADLYVCPNDGPGGAVFAATAAGVWINGRPAIAIGDPVTCPSASHHAGIVSGYPGVLMGGRLIAREWDQSSSTGRIVEGSSNVLIGPAMTEAETMEAALFFITYSDFAKSSHGKEVVVALLTAQVQGRIIWASTLTDGQKIIAGKYDSKNDKIYLNRASLEGDPRSTARILVHEGTHAANDVPGPGQTEASFDEEYAAWEAERAWWDEHPGDRLDDKTAKEEREGHYAALSEEERKAHVRKAYGNKWSPDEP